MSLHSIRIPASVETMGEMVFAGDTENLRRTRRSLDGPDKILYFHDGNSHATDCALQSITFEPGSKLTKIERATFGRCLVLRAIHIPNRVTIIGQSAFADTFSLSSVTFEHGSQLGIIEDSAFMDSALSSITFADNSILTLIGPGAFRKCPNLNLVKIPNSVETISQDAFSASTDTIGRLTSVQIPNATIGTNAFQNQACNENLYQNGTTMCGCDPTDDSCFAEAKTSDSGVSTGVIVGASVGGAVGLGIIALSISMCTRTTTTAKAQRPLY